ncbi:MAG TPA: single-stranded-DNA-specific exonuclease RecJ, partial [Anaerolineae bacterium]|nr:single-stranded-DNA-specific exonuclease RecJ [Anaerolineae bacterium]
MKRWLEPQETPVPAALREAVGGHPLVAETLARRGITDPAQARAFLDPRLYRPAPPTDLPGLLRAAERVEEAIRRRETICIWGDFDAGGQTSTAVLLSTLRDLGATVCYHVPHRRRESHGVNLPVLKDLLA